MTRLGQYMVYVCFSSDLQVIKNNAVLTDIAFSTVAHRNYTIYFIIWVNITIECLSTLTILKHFGFNFPFALSYHK